MAYICILNSTVISVRTNDMNTCFHLPNVDRGVIYNSRRHTLCLKTLRTGDCFGLEKNIYKSVTMRAVNLLY